MRSIFTKCIQNSAKKNKNFLVLTGDHGNEIFNNFKKKFPKQFINAGVAEQNMVGVAAGLSRVGFVPLVYGLSSFIPIRVYEQIKLDIAHDSLKVIFIGDGAGLVYSYLGTSHQSIEDIASLRPIPNLRIYSPADGYEMKYCFEEALASKGPSYIRIGKSDLPKIHKKNLLKNNNIIKIKSAKDSKIAILATGSMVSKAYKISNFFKCSVYSILRIKPMEENLITKMVSKYQFIVTMEEHSVYGGLGSAITESASRNGSVKILRIGVEDKFTEKCGSYEYTLKSLGLDDESIISKIKNFVI